MNIDERVYGYEPAATQLEELRLAATLLKRIVKLDEDPHPGLSTWVMFREKAHREALALINKL